MTQSIATTGVSTMTGQFKAASGLAGTPSITFGSALGTGFYLAGSNQIGWVANGVQGATFNADLSVTFSGAISGKGAIPIGTVADFAGSTTPSGWLLCFGQLVSTTTYAGLFAVLSTTYGSGSGTFGIPDYRGRSGYGQDNMGGSAAGRITATLNYDGTILGNSGGGQSHLLTSAEMPVHNHGVTDPSHNHSNGTGGLSFNGNAAGYPATGADIAHGSNSSTQFATTGISIQNAGSGGSHTILSPSIITNKIIYAGV